MLKWLLLPTNAKPWELPTRWPGLSAAVLSIAVTNVASKDQYPSLVLIPAQFVRMHVIQVFTHKLTFPGWLVQSCLKALPPDELDILCI